MEARRFTILFIAVLGLLLSGLVTEVGGQQKDMTFEPIIGIHRNRHTAVYNETMLG